LNKRLVTITVVVCGLILTYWVLTLGFAFRTIRSGKTWWNPVGAVPQKVTAPTVPPSNSMAVFPFRPKGDSQAKYYAAGFARALADRTNCAPRCITQQPTIDVIVDRLSSLGLDRNHSAGDAQILKVGKTLGVRYVVMGDFGLSNGSASIALQVYDLNAKSPTASARLKSFCTMQSLPSAQADLAIKLAQATKLTLGASQVNELKTPNFTQAGTLELYGRSYFAKDFGKVKEYRWKMVRSDPTSSFAAIRLLEYYVNGPSTCREIMKDGDLSAFLSLAAKQFPDNSHLIMLQARLLDKQYRYTDALNALQPLVRDDPAFSRAHDALAWVAYERQDAELAIAESRKEVSLWPTSGVAHQTLSSCLQLASNNARRGRVPRAMSTGPHNTWYTSCMQSFREAQIAILLDRRLEDAWWNIVTCGRELNYRQEVDRAFGQLVSLDPKNYRVYKEYGFCFSPQWGGDPSRQEQILRQGELRLGAKSPEASMLRGWTMFCNYSPRKDLNQILNYADDAIRKSKTPYYDAMELKRRTLGGLGRQSEMMQVAQQGFDLWPNPDWRMALAHCYQGQWDSRRDIRALNKAQDLLTVYVRETPFDPNGHVQLGWCYSHQGEREDAKREFLKALEIDPDNELAKQKMKYVQ
jgi:tetratricopeptide (TPR) repeat protein